MASGPIRIQPNGELYPDEPVETQLAESPILFTPAVQKPLTRLPTVPGYEVVRRLGSGGMGVVYLAKQDGTHRPVALKMLRGALAYDDDSRTRFAEEIKIIARLRHPNIVTVYEAGTVEDVPYVALEFVDGPNLARYIDGQPQEYQRSSWIVEQIANSIQYAHEQGVIHRDLKPANILIAFHSTEAALPTDSAQVPTMPLVPMRIKVTDFGLAKLIGHSPIRTQTGLAAGTPGYMSPEQAAGDRNHIGPWSDVYSLGVILYELLTGRAPFADLDPSAVLHATKNLEPTPIHRIRPEVPSDLETICLKCLAKRPEDRYLTAADLGSDLARFRLGQPIVARRQSPIERAVQFSRKNPTTVRLAAALFASLVVGIISVSMLYFASEQDRKLANEALDAVKVSEQHATTERLRAEAAEREARTSEAHAREEARRASAAEKEALTKRGESEVIRQFLLYDLLGSAAERGIKPNISFRELVTVAAAKVDTRFKNNPLAAADVEHAFGLYFAAIQDFPNAVHHTRRHVAFREQALGADHTDTLTARQQLASILLMVGEQEEAYRIVRELVVLRENRQGLDHAATINLLAWFGRVLSVSSHELEAERILEKAHPAAVRVHGAEANITTQVAKSLRGVRLRNGTAVLVGAVVYPGSATFLRLYIREPRKK